MFKTSHHIPNSVHSCTLSGFLDHYTSVTIITDIVAILLKCVTGSYDC